MPLNRADIESLIPHAGDMVLLDHIVSCQADSLHARTASHLEAGNPLRHWQKLPISAGIEYAAQAAAVHGALTAQPSGANRPGFLALVKETRWYVDRLDDITFELDIRVTQLSVQPASVMYSFQVSAEENTLLTGRLAVFFAEPGTLR